MARFGEEAAQPHEFGVRLTRHLLEDAAHALPVTLQLRRLRGQHIDERLIRQCITSDLGMTVGEIGIASACRDDAFRQ
ncbi:MAG: hypothetical protein U1E15_05505 [Hyphomicrobiales bacterium]